MYSGTKKSRSQQIIVIKTNNALGESVSEQFYNHSYTEDYQPPAFIIYQLLTFIIRRQICKPFQLLKQFLLFPSDEEDSIEIEYKYMKYEVELAGQNIRNVCKLYKQRLLVEGFITIKLAYYKKIRIEKAYYNSQNLMRICTSLTFLRNIQNIYMKWQGFGKFYQNYKGYRLSKINLSKISIVNSGYTSNYFDDFNPLLLERVKEIQAINSYIIDRSSDQNDSLAEELAKKDNIKMDHKQFNIIQQFSSAERHESNNIKHHKQNIIEQSIQKNISSNNIKKYNKSSIESYDRKQIKEGDELQQKILITHRKQIQRQQAGSTNKQRRNNIDSQKLYLIRDYYPKDKAPSNFVRIPVLSQNIKIIQVQTGRKRTHKKRVVKQQIHIQTQICQNCKYCIQKKQRKQIFQVIEQRIHRVQYVTVHKEVSSTQFSTM